jgi:hypothetical protein
MATPSSIFYKNATLLNLLQKKDKFNSYNPDIIDKMAYRFFKEWWRY